jgi:hypothetical protein
MREHFEKGAILEAETGLAQTLILGFSTSKTIRNKFLSHKHFVISA